MVHFQIADFYHTLGKSAFGERRDFSDSAEVIPQQTDRSALVPREIQEDLRASTGRAATDERAAYISQADYRISISRSRQRIDRQLRNVFAEHGRAQVR